MKKSEVIISVKLGDVLDASNWRAWEEMCKKYGINEWCINEGRASDSDTVDISLKDAENWGLIKDDE